MNRLRADFDKYGIEAIREARERDPMGYVRVVAALVPPEATLNVEHSFSDVLQQAARRAQELNQKPADTLPSVIEGQAEKVESGDP